MTEKSKEQLEVIINKLLKAHFLFHSFIYFVKMFEAIDEILNNIFVDHNRQ
jgi:hypothetical protein